MGLRSAKRDQVYGTLDGDTDEDDPKGGTKLWTLEGEERDLESQHEDFLRHKIGRKYTHIPPQGQTSQMVELVF